MDNSNTLINKTPKPDKKEPLKTATIVLIIIAVIAAFWAVGYVTKDQCRSEIIPYRTVDQYETKVRSSSYNPEQFISRQGALGRKDICKKPLEKEYREVVVTQPQDKIVVHYTYTDPPAPTPVQYTAPAQSSGARTGAICADGTTSSATGRGACSHHGGVSQWLY